MSGPKSTNMMYVQQLAHLPAQDLDTLKGIVEQKVQQEGLSEKDSNRWRAVIVREFIKAMNI